MGSELLTGHWTATNPSEGFYTARPDYHVQYLQRTWQPRQTILEWGKRTALKNQEWDELASWFEVKKFLNFDQASAYATWRINHDPRTGTAPNICVTSVSMVDATTSDFGAYPFTYLHAWMMADLMAKVAYLKDIDLGGSFPDSVEPSVLQNGPIYVCSVHGERALQTKDAKAKVPRLGYFLYSGEPDLRWDCAVRDSSEAYKLLTVDSAVSACHDTASWFRAAASSRLHMLKAAPGDSINFFGLDKSA